MKTKSKISDSGKSYIALTALSLMATNSSDEVPRIFYEPYIQEIHNPISTPTSTRFNDSNRFSLDKLKSNKKRLLHLKNLKSNWNGYNGKPINNDIIEQAECLLTNLDYQPSIFPTGRGTIQIEYFKDEDNELEIEIFSNEIFMYKVEDGVEQELSIDADQVSEIINKFYA